MIRLTETQQIALAAAPAGCPKFLHGLGTDLGTSLELVSTCAAILAACSEMMADKVSAVFVVECLSRGTVDHTQEHTEVSALELAEMLEGFGVVHQLAHHPSRMPL